MRYFFDTEFIEDGKTIDLLSIGVVSDDGREYYAENIEADRDKASDWVRENVFPFLGKIPEAEKTRAHIARDLVEFCSPEKHGKPEFWAYYADYDWVVLCQLFGRMIDLPEGWPMYCRDIKQEVDRISANLGVKIRLPEQGATEHFALADAVWNRRAHQMLMGY